MNYTQTAFRSGAAKDVKLPDFQPRAKKSRESGDLVEPPIRVVMLTIAVISR